MGLDHSDHIFGTILDVYAAAGSIRTNDFIDNSRPCDHNRKLCGSSHITPKFVTTTINLITHNAEQKATIKALLFMNVNRFNGTFGFAAVAQYK